MPASWSDAHLIFKVNLFDDSIIQTRVDYFVCPFRIDEVCATTNVFACSYHVVFKINARLVM